MSDLASLAILIALLLAVAGAIRFDLLGPMWREMLKLGGDAPPAPMDSSHGPYQAAGPRLRRRASVNAQRPAIHRSGRRS